MIELFDTHQHLIHRGEGGYDWTAGIDALREGEFTLADYRRLTEDRGIGGTLFMETGINDSDHRREARFVAGLARDPASGIRGLIASIRPEEDDGFEEWLEQGDDLGVVGYRRILHTVDDGISQTDSFRRNVRRIGDAGKTFDACFLARQLPIALELAQACDGTSIVLDHCGVPDIAGGSLDPWRGYINALAAMPNVSCKLSGIMAYCAPGKSSLEAIAPYVDHVLEAFGAGRIVWGSDWPVVDTARGLPAWIDATREILAGLSEDEARMIASGNAERIYKARMAG